MNTKTDGWAMDARGRTAVRARSAGGFAVRTAEPVRRGISETVNEWHRLDRLETPFSASKPVAKVGWMNPFTAAITGFQLRPWR